MRYKSPEEYILRENREIMAILRLLPLLHCPLWNKLQATECYINHSSCYLFHSMYCKTGEQR